MRRLFTYIVLGYLSIAAIWYGYQHLVFFQPKALAAGHLLSFPVKVKFSTAQIPFDLETVLDVVKFEPENGKPKGVVLFFHGNRFNIEHYSVYAPYFTQRGFACWMVDYPGYGRSTGEMSIPILKETGTQLYKMAAAQFHPDSIIVYGKSLGTGIATFVAGTQPSKALVLETPYYSLNTLAGNYLFYLPVNFLERYNIDSYQQLKRCTEPVTIIHGTKDELIPVDHMARLIKLLKPADALYLVQDARHNSLPDFPAYHLVLDSVLAN